MSEHRRAVDALAPIRKAVAGAAAAGFTTAMGVLGAAMSDGNLTSQEVVIAVGAGLVAAATGGGAVYAAPANRTTP